MIDTIPLVCPNCGSAHLRVWEKEWVTRIGAVPYLDPEFGPSIDYDNAYDSDFGDGTSDALEVSCLDCDLVDLDLDQLVTRELYEAATEGLVTA